MKLRTRKRLLNVSSLGCILAAGWVVLAAYTAAPPVVESVTPKKGKARDAEAVPPSPLKTVSVSQPGWRRQLRQPLYDPPPRPKVVVKKKPRPITVKLTGTVLEPKNSQAFLRLANGSVALKKVGDQVTDDPRDGQITQITASEIVIKREDDEVRLRVDSRN